MKDGKYKIKKELREVYSQAPGHNWRGLGKELPENRIITIEDGLWNHWSILDEMIECAVECGTCKDRRDCGNCEDHSLWTPKEPASYLERHNASGLKVGDWVRVTRMPQGRENGWEWDDTRETIKRVMVGNVYEISSDFYESGFSLSGSFFPYFVLEKVAAPVEEKKMETGRVIGSYDGKPVTEYQGKMYPVLPLGSIPVGSRVVLVSVDELHVRDSIFMARKDKPCIKIDEYNYTWPKEPVPQRTCIFPKDTAIVLDGPREVVGGATCDMPRGTPVAIDSLGNIRPAFAIQQFSGTTAKILSTKQRRMAKVLSRMNTKI